jgi:hypothetical protein
VRFVFLFSILSQDQNASLIKQGLPGLSPRPTCFRRQDRRVPRGRWPALSLRTLRRVSYRGDRSPGPFRHGKPALFHPSHRSDAMAPETHALSTTNGPFCDPRSSVSILIGKPIPRPDRFCAGTGLIHDFKPGRGIGTQIHFRRLCAGTTEPQRYLSNVTGRLQDHHGGQEKTLTGVATAPQGKSVRSPFWGGDPPKSGPPPASAHHPRRNRSGPCSADRRAVMYLDRGTLVPWRSLRSGFPP